MSKVKKPKIIAVCTAVQCACGYYLYNPGYGKNFVSCPKCGKHQPWGVWAYVEVKR